MIDGGDGGGGLHRGVRRMECNEIAAKRRKKREIFCLLFVYLNRYLLAGKGRGEDSYFASFAPFRG
jgi:hypothetical protein